MKQGAWWKLLASLYPLIFLYRRQRYYDNIFSKKLVFNINKNGTSELKWLKQCLNATVSFQTQYELFVLTVIHWTCIFWINSFYNTHHSIKTNLSILERKCKIFISSYDNFFNLWNLQRYKSVNLQRWNSKSIFDYINQSRKMI